MQLSPEKNYVLLLVIKTTSWFIILNTSSLLYFFFFSRSKKNSKHSIVLRVFLTLVAVNPVFNRHALRVMPSRHTLGGERLIRLSFIQQNVLSFSFILVKFQSTARRK
jgi:hypothetical protein